MHNIIYYSPKYINDALKYLNENSDAKIIAGGTDIIARWKKINFPDMRLVDVKEIESFADISETESELFIGAGTKIETVHYSEKIINNLPILSKAAGMIGSVQIRNMATIGGNCCNAAPSADTALPLIVYGAKAVIASLDGEKHVPLQEFFKAPGKTVLSAGEILKGFYIPKQKKNSSAAFLKHSRRVGMDLATVGVAVNLTVDEKCNCQSIKIALGAVGPTPILIDATEIVKDSLLTENNMEAIAEFSAEKASPISDVRGTKEYRKAMIKENIKNCIICAMKNF